MCTGYGRGTGISYFLIVSTGKGFSTSTKMERIIKLSLHRGFHLFLNITWKRFFYSIKFRFLDHFRYYFINRNFNWMLNSCILWVWLRNWNSNILWNSIRNWIGNIDRYSFKNGHMNWSSRFWMSCVDILISSIFTYIVTICIKTMKNKS